MDKKTAISAHLHEMLTLISLHLLTSLTLLALYIQHTGLSVGLGDGKLY